MKKILRYLMLAVSVAIALVVLILLIRTKSQEHTSRDILVSMLQLDLNTTLIEAEIYLDCNLIKKGMTIDEVKYSLAQLHPISLTERFSENNTGSIKVTFDNIPYLKSRTYYFVRGFLDFHSKASDDPTEGSSPIQCD